MSTVKVDNLQARSDDVLTIPSSLNVTGYSANVSGNVSVARSLAVGYTDGRVPQANLEVKGNTYITGDTTIGGNLVFSTADKGVYLGVTSATAANLLDDYETGTWTPAFTSTSATFGYTTQGGTYTKVGRICTASFRLQLSGSPSGTTTNSLFISGLPFATATLADTYHGTSLGHYYNFNLTQTGIMCVQLSSGASTTELKVIGDNLGETAVLASAAGSAAQIRGQIVYQTA